MQEKDIKLLFDAGDLTRADIVPLPMEAGWGLQFNRRKGHPVMMDAQRVQPRRFKTLDAAYKTLIHIGFREARIIAQ
ncbi:hypothetical protein RJ45_09590 [Photobacterium gaetbulicola]|uniref:Plasmid replication protein RepB n=2 Tax=Photobacterium gaetbulicola TaxID=1295392 RepID=A0A0B9G539_9GAMM|nr:hypothetical protein RJ45_09590 [Photobacterium gaetbulicola]